MSQYPNQPYGGPPGYTNQPQQPNGGAPQGYGLSYPQGYGQGQPYANQPYATGQGQQAGYSATPQPGYGQGGQAPQTSYPTRYLPQPGPPTQPQQGFMAATPPPTPPRKKRINPLLWVGIGALALMLILVLVVVSILNGNSTKSGKLGETLKLGSYSASVDTIDCSHKQLTDEYDIDTYTAVRGQYCLIKVTVTNNSKSTVYVDQAYQKLYVGSNVYSADTNTTSTLVLDDAMEFVDLPPDVTKSMTVVFDSPSAKPDRLRLQVGTYGDAKTADVTLT